MMQNSVQWILSLILILSSVGVVLLKKPVHACLSFLLSLLTLATVYLQLSAEFVAVMQILVYAGAILVIFMFVIVLFQDAYLQIEEFKEESNRYLITGAVISFIAAFVYLGSRFDLLSPKNSGIGVDFGTVQALGNALYLNFFFPFEAVILLFLISIVGALYIGRKEAG